MMPFKQCPDAYLLQLWETPDLTYEEMRLSIVHKGYDLEQFHINRLKLRMRRLLKRLGRVPPNATARHYRQSRLVSPKGRDGIDWEALN